MTEVELPSQIQPLAINLRRQSLESNFFTPRIPTNNFAVYAVDFLPPVENENRQLRGTLVRKCESELDRRLGKFVMSGINLFAVGKTGEVELTLEVPESEYRLVLRKVRMVQLGNVVGNRDAQLVLNILFKRALKALGLLQLTRLPKFYDAQRVDRIEEFKLSVWKGYTMELNVYETNPYACIDFASKVIHTNTVLDVISEDDFSRVSHELNGRIVISNYGNHRCYNIDEVDFTQNPTNTFFNDRLQRDITYAAYFETTYNKKISNMRQPLLRNTNRKTGKTVFLVPELVSLTGLDDRMRSNRRVMQTLANSTRLRPSDRFSQSRNLAARLNEPTAQAVLSPFQVSVSSQSHTVSGFSFPSEEIRDGEGTVPIGDRGDFRLHAKILAPVGLERWTIMSDDWRKGDDVARELVSALQRLSREVRDPDRVDFPGRNLDRVFRDMSTHDPPPQIVVLLLAGRSEGQRKAIYSEIKSLSIAQHPLLTQVAFLPLNEKNHRSIIEKLALQIQAKVGATLWQIKPIDSFSRYVMVVGIDTFHDTVNRQQSVIGFCATIDKYMSRYYSTATFHPVGQEIGTTIGVMMREALIAFRAKWNRYPENIVFFRDGVSESQVTAVSEMEVRPLLSLFSTMQDYHPFVTYTLVVKKTNAKFYATGGEVRNPKPGTLVTEDVVPKRGDFYLIAHSPYQGIATPVLYRTVYTSRPIDYPQEDLARLAYRLCHMYSNWTGAVKVPAPCMMAHKLAFMLGQSVHSAIQPQLKQYSFYL